MHACVLLGAAHVYSAGSIADNNVSVAGSHELHLFRYHFHLKGPVQAQPLVIAGATSAAGQSK